MVFLESTDYVEVIAFEELRSMVLEKFFLRPLRLKSDTSQSRNMMW